MPNDRVHVSFVHCFEHRPTNSYLSFFSPSFALLLHSTALTPLPKHANLLFISNSHSIGPIAERGESDQRQQSHYEHLENCRLKILGVGKGVQTSFGVLNINKPYPARSRHRRNFNLRTPQPKLMRHTSSQSKLLKSAVLGTYSSSEAPKVRNDEPNACIVAS